MTDKLILLVNILNQIDDELLMDELYSITTEDSIEITLDPIVLDEID